MNITPDRCLSLLSVFLTTTTLFSPRSVHCQEMGRSEANKEIVFALEKTSHDFGNVLQGDSARVSIPLRNTGDEAIGIYSLDSSSENIRATLSSKSIPPGGSADLEIRLDTETHLGPVNGEISMITSLAEQRELVFKVTGNVRPALAVEPPVVFAGRVAKADSFPGRARLSGKMVEEGHIPELMLETSSEHLRAKIVPRDFGGRPGASVEFVLLPSAKAGTFKETVTVSSANPPAQAVLTIAGEKLGNIKVNPDRLEFFAAEGAQPQPQSISIDSPKFMRITRIEDLSGLLDISLEMLEDGKIYRVDAKLKGPLQGSFLGLVKVYTDLEEQPLIDIPVIGGFTGFGQSSTIPQP
jgi:hypothetical protein